MRRLDIGSGDNPIEGYEHNDVQAFPHIEHLGPIQDLEFPEGTFQEIHGSGCLEHLTYWQAAEFMRRAFKWLEPGGVLDINAPDIDHWIEYLVQQDPRTAWVNSAFRGWCRWEGDEHKSWWGEEMLCNALRAVGFVDLDVYQHYWYSGPDDWHICVKAFKPKP
jgi:predicted SAM-dependent methyltransferase